MNSLPFAFRRHVACRFGDKNVAAALGMETALTMDRANAAAVKVHRRAMEDVEISNAIFIDNLEGRTGPFVE